MFNLLFKLSKTFYETDLAKYYVIQSRKRNYGRIFNHFGDIQRQRLAWPWNLGLGLFKVIENGTVG